MNFLILTPSVGPLWSQLMASGSPNPHASNDKPYINNSKNTDRDLDIHPCQCNTTWFLDLSIMRVLDMSNLKPPTSAYRCASPAPL